MALPRSALAAWTVDRPIATGMILCAVVVFGLIAARQLPVMLMPELSYPTLTVQTTWPGAAPEEVEDAITRPVEELVRTVEGLLAVESSSRAGTSEVRLRFRWRVSMDVASQRVRERLELVDWPDGAERPAVLRYDPALEPTLRLALVGDRSAAALHRLADTEVRRMIERVPGVAMIRLYGGEEEVVEVALRESALARHGLTVRDVEERLRAENVNVAGGRLEEGGQEVLVRTVQQFTTIEELESLILRADDRQLLRLREIATIRPGVREGRGILRMDAREGVELAIFREADANLVQVAEAVRAALEAGEDTLPADVEIVVLTDSSRFVRAALEEVTQAALYGAGIAVLVLLVFLRRLGATLIIGLAIPLSVLATLGAFRVLGVGLNLMSLGGLALGIGMLVDNAIVVLEAIVRRREQGAGPRDAAIEGTGSVAVAVTSSTLTTMAVFLPVVFLDGVAGQLFGDLAMAVVLSLLASLVFALTFVPMLAGRASWAPEPRPWRSLLTWGAGRELLDDVRGLVRRRWGGLLLILALPWILLRFALTAPFSTIALGWRLVREGMARTLLFLVTRYQARASKTPQLSDSRRYGTLLSILVKAPWTVVGLALVVFAVSVSAATSLPRQLLPTLYEGRFDVQLSWPVGTALEETSERALRLERALLADPAIAQVASFMGPSTDGFDDRERGEHIAWMTLVAERTEEGAQVDEQRMQAALRRLLREQPAVDARIERPTLLALTAPVQVELRGHDLDALRESAARIETRMRDLHGVDEVRSSARPGFPELRLAFDRERLASWGLDARAVAEGVRQKVQGVGATQLSRDGVAVDVWLALDRGDLRTVDDLLQLDIGRSSSATPGGAAGAMTQAAGGLPVVPPGADAQASGQGEAVNLTLGQVATVVPGRGPAEIRRLEGQRAAVVTADVSLLDLRTVAHEVQRAVFDLELHPTQTLRLGGQVEEMEGATQALAGALWLAIFLVVVVLASTFESLRAPMLILGSLPLAFTGVVVVLLMAREPFSVLAVLGGIVLVGIVVNNAIVLVDAVRQRAEAGEPWPQCVVEGASARLRPVLMTAATTVLGLLPMVLATGDGAEIRRPLALVLVGGLTTGTLLTLVVIPALLAATRPFGKAPVRDASTSLSAPE